MTTYYVSTAGSNANNGLGPDASALTNKPWLTIAKALAAGSPVVPGDTVYVGPGIYYGTAAATAISGVSSTGSPLQIIGDPLNAQGFKDGSGVRLPAGLCWITTRTSGEGLNGTIASVAGIVTTATNATKGLQFKKLVFETKPGTAVFTQNMGGSTDTLFEDCALYGGGASFTGGTPTAGMNLTFRRCEGVVNQLLTCQNTSAAATADADLNVLVEQCFFIGSIAVSMALSASGGNLAGGVRVQRSLFIPNSGNCWTTTASRVSTVTPCRLKGVLILSGAASQFSAGTAGQIIDDGYCIETPAGSHTNLTAAGTSVVGGVMPNLNFPLLARLGLTMPSIDMFGWSDAAHANQKFAALSTGAADLRGRTVSPWGAGESIGPWQAQSVAQDATSAVTGGGTNSLKLTGAGEASIWVPVDATATTISVVTVSGSYGGTNWPQLIVCANPDLGIASDQTVAATSASVQTITSPSFTPSAKGVVEVRMVSRSSSTSSTTNFDTLSSP